jgi:hypothetical protein
MVQNLIGSNIWNLTVSINLWNVSNPTDKGFAFYINFEDSNLSSYDSYAFNQTTPYTMHSNASTYNNTSSNMLTYTYTDRLDLTGSVWDGNSGKFNIWWYGDQTNSPAYNIVISITRTNEI